MNHVLNFHRALHYTATSLKSMLNKVDDDTILDLAVWGFALWTILCWTLTSLEQSFALLVALSPLIPGLLWATRRVVFLSPVKHQQDEFAQRNSRRPLALLLALLAPAIAFGMGLWIVGWVLACVSLLLAASGQRWAEGAFPLPKTSPQAWILPWILITMIVAVGARRPDADDGGYHAVTLAAAEQPESALLCCEVWHGLSGVALDPPTQRLKSLELLVALPVFLLEIPPWWVYHLLIPLLGAAALCIAHRRLYQRLVPERWYAVFVVTLFLLLTLGTAHAWPGNFGLVRLHQGKGLLVSILLPLLVVYGLEAGAWGGSRRWLRLLGGQIAAIGLNQTALVVAPVTAVLAVLAGFSRRPGGRSRAGWMVIAVAALPSVLGLSLWSVMSPRFEQAVGAKTGGELLRQASEYVFGQGILAPVVVLSFLVCPWCVRSGPVRRWAVLVPLAALVGPLNPWLAWIFAVGVFGDTTFWRIFWLLPIIAAMALTITAAEGTTWLTARARRGLTVLACVTVLSLADEQLLGSENGVDWAPFQPKMPVAERAAATSLVKAVRPGSLVLAPGAVAPWVAIFPDRPFLWVVTPRYLRSSFGYVDERRQLLRFASGRSCPECPELLARRLPLFSGLLLHHQSLSLKNVRGLLIDGGFASRGHFGPYELWIRGRPVWTTSP